MEVDPRFYEALGPARVADLAALAGAAPLDAADGTAEIATAAPLDRAGPGAVTFFQERRYEGGLATTQATACFVRERDAESVREAGVIPIIVDWPQAAFARAARALFRPRALEIEQAPGARGPSVDPAARIAAAAVVSPAAIVSAEAVVEPFAVIGPGVRIGPRARVGPGAVVGFADVGADCVILAGAVIGEAGFGLAQDPSGPLDVPHLGRVILEDDVTIGANTTVDRGMFDDTRIGRGTKIDNLVQIAHNVQIGRGCVVAGCCGLSGSVVLEDGVMLGGSVGIADHVRIGARARLAADAAVFRDVPSGETWSGSPARPIRTFFREVAVLSRLARRSSGREES
ncbi:MAG: UDP-3-O-(3-hydroxymyristoyl)glucosamine N-acyltransferase [Caulobacterales bacterium]|nr:UDP-3-O-(3-hydroxymyristoyl)glucosamine N-acyltransferase [Caulobacterales bacterium]